MRLQKLKNPKRLIESLVKFSKGRRLAFGRDGEPLHLTKEFETFSGNFRGRL